MSGAPDRSLSRWMGEIYRQPSYLSSGIESILVADLPLSRLFMVGSHNSAAREVPTDEVATTDAYTDESLHPSLKELAPGSKPAVRNLISRFRALVCPCWRDAFNDLIFLKLTRPWAVCQHASTLEQLNAGVRYLDFRICVRRNTKAGGPVERLPLIRPSDIVDGLIFSDDDDAVMIPATPRAEEDSFDGHLLSRTDYDLAGSIPDPSERRLAHSEQYWILHTVFFSDLEQHLRGVQQFLEENPSEVVLIDLQHLFYTSSRAEEEDAWSPDNPSPPDPRPLMRFVIRHLGGPRLIYLHEEAHSATCRWPPTLRRCRDSGRRIVLFLQSRVHAVLRQMDPALAAHFQDRHASMSSNWFGFMDIGRVMPLVDADIRQFRQESNRRLKDLGRRPGDDDVVDEEDVDVTIVSSQTARLHQFHVSQFVIPTSFKNWMDLRNWKLRDVALPATQMVQAEFCTGRWRDRHDFNIVLCDFCTECNDLVRNLIRRNVAE